MVTRPALWSIVPDPFDLTVDSRTWKHYTDSVDYRAREVTGHVNPACMLSNLRRNNQGDPQEHSLSDVDRAAKRVDAWTRMMMVLIPYRDAVSKQLVLSPVDPAISKRNWERHLCNIRRSFVLLESELPGKPSDDCLGGTSLLQSPQQRLLSDSKPEACRKKATCVAYMDGPDVAHQRGSGQAFITARDIWDDLASGRAVDERNKFFSVIRDLLQRHAASLTKMPVLVDLLPHPRERVALTKRQWESLLYRARTILDLIQQQKHKLLYHYIHAEAAKLPLGRQCFLDEFSDPEEFSAEWLASASAAAVQLQFLRLQNQSERFWEGAHSSPRSRETASFSMDVIGGSTTLDVQQRKRISASRLEACGRKAARRIASATGLLPTLQQPAAFSFPSSPAAFDSENSPDVDVLRLLRAHPRDFKIRFEASHHRYYIDGVQTKGSVTGVIHSFCTPFDADKVITNMVNGQNWPRAGYLRREVSFTSMARLRVLCPELLDQYASSPRDDIRISSMLRAISSMHNIEDEIAQLTLSREDVKAMWATAGAEAAQYGTYMHYIFEALINGHSVPDTSPEVRMLRSFLATLEDGATAWRTEWTIYGEDEQLAGSIDFCARLVDGSLVVVDWKRTSGLPNKYHSFQCMRPPISHLADCTGVHYRLQLNVYRHLLEKYYGQTVSRMMVVCCHPEHYPTAFVDEVPRLEKETVDMLAAWRDVRGGTCWCRERIYSGGWSHMHLRLSRYSLRLLQEEIPIVMCHDFCGGSSQASLMQPLGAALDEPWCNVQGERLEKESDLLGGASQASASDWFPQVGEEPIEDADVQPEQGLVSREDTFQVQDEFAEELEMHLEIALSAEGKEGDLRLEQARKRRLLPGADTTMNSFRDLFDDLNRTAGVCLAEVSPLVGQDEPSIPTKVSRIRQFILRKIPDMEESLLRLVTGAITVYRLRLADLHLRELVVLLWIIEGERSMRCHDGNLYFFHLGAFALHKGVPPQATLARCKRFFLQLEGLFRLMGSAKLTCDDDVLGVLQELLQTRNNSASNLLNECEDAAFSHIPRPAGGSRGRAPDAAEPAREEAPNAVATSDGRCRGLADALSKAGYAMQTELLRDKIFNLVVEWCDSPPMRSAGISYQDCAFLYDQMPGQSVTAARGVPEDNIYVHIPHPLLRYNLDDPVLLRAQQSLTRFYSETFWLNNDDPRLLLAELF